MSIMMLAIEYLILHTVFETIRQNDEESSRRDELIMSQNRESLSRWKPLSEHDLNFIKEMVNQRG